MKNFADEMPGKVAEMLSLAREKKKLEVEAWARGQARREQEKYADDTVTYLHYSKSNGYGYGPEVWEAMLADIDGMYSDIEETIMAYATPDPEAFTPLIDATDQAYLTLNGGEAGTVADEANLDLKQDWQGGFADTLTDFLAPIASVETNQSRIAEALRESLKATQVVYGAAQRDVSWLVDSAIEALEACGESNGSDAKTALLFLGTVLAIAGTPFTAGWSLVIIGTTVNYVAGEIDGDNGGEHPMGADTVDGVMNNLITGLNQVRQGMESDEQEVIENLEDNFAVVSMFRAAAHGDGVGSRYLPLAPTINTASDPTSGLEPDD